MSSINSISAEKLARLVGTPKCPVLVDVCSDEDFAAAPRLVPGAVRRPYADAADWAGEFSGRSVVVICQKGFSVSRRASSRDFPISWRRRSSSSAKSLR